MVKCWRPPRDCSACCPCCRPPATGRGRYRLGAGANLPPLLLDDDEAVAVAVGLRTAVTGTVTGIEDTALRALAKLEKVLPTRLRRRVSALGRYTVPIAPDHPGPRVDADTLSMLAHACRDHERVTFDYTSHDGTATVRTAEPYRLVTWGRRWYLVAYDVDRGDWRTFRVERLTPRPGSGARFTRREFPGGDVAAYVAGQVSAAAWRYRARVVIHAAADVVAARINPAVGVVEPVDETTCVLDTGADTVETLAVYLGLLDADFRVTEPPELVAHLRRLATRYRSATD